MEAFSDGVFAIAITLLVLEISVPTSAFDHLWRGIANQWPSYLAYVTSFLTIGGLWLVHHAVFRRMRFADQVVLRLNLLLLMLVSFLPFPTKLMAEALHEKAGEHAAVLFYGATLLVITSIVAAMGRYAAREQLIAEHDHREAVRDPHAQMGRHWTGESAADAEYRENPPSSGRGSSDANDAY